MAINAAFDTSPVPIGGPPRTNPYLDEIDAATQNAHAQLSPGAQEALKRAGAPIPGQAAPAQPTPQITSPTQPIRSPWDEKLPNGQDAMLAGTGIQSPRPSPAMPLPGGVRGNAANNFNTTLSPGEEPQFQQWKSEFAPKDSGEDYDLRGAYKYGLTPSAENGHWSDRFKKPNEPTFSNESQYAQDAPQKAGHWNGDTYVPPAAIAPPPGAHVAPTPVQLVPNTAEMAPAQKEVNRLTIGPESKSGREQLHSPWARIPLGILEALGTGFAPGLTSAIPGTQLHHNMLVGQAENAVGQQEKIRKSEEEAELNAANQSHLQGETAHNLAQANALTNPQDKIATNEIELFQKDPASFMQYHTLVQKATATHEPQFVKDGEGNIVGMIDGEGKPHSAADPNLDPQAKAIMDNAKAKPNTSEQSTDIKNYQFAKGQGYAGTFEQWQKEEANRKNPKPPGESGTWELIEQNGKPMQMNSRSGAIRPAPEGVGRLGTAEKEAEKTRPAKEAVTFGRNYLDSGDFNGSEDQALIDKAYQLMNSGTKRAPSPVQQKIIMESRSAMQGAAAIAKHYVNPNATWLDDTQRKNLVKTMEDIARANGIDVTPGGGGNDMVDAQIPGQPPNQIHRSQVDAFRKKYPNATIGQ